MKRYVLIVLTMAQLASISPQALASSCGGRFINPITDVCWGCLLPITIGASTVFKGRLPDTKNPSSPVCLCPGFPLPRIGISLGYWEPTFLVDVTRDPFCLVNLGGIKLDLGSHWTAGMVNTVMPMNQTSFYQVHWYIFPLMHWLNLLGDLACQEEADFDLAYLTELDPLWNDEELALILNPEALVFANTPAQLACGADVIAASSNHLPIDSLFWCAGAQGSYYPLTGFVREHHGGVHASTLLAERMNFKLHRELLAWDSSPGALCTVKPYAIMPKSRYRYQMTSPVPATKYPNGAQPFGHSTLTWEAGHSYPGKGEHFGYLIWRKRNCCGL